MSCPYSEEELAKWDSVNNPMGDACYTCDDCDCEHWAGPCEGCTKYEKWPECGGPQGTDPEPDIDESPEAFWERQDRNEEDFKVRKG